MHVHIVAVHISKLYNKRGKIFQYLLIERKKQRHKIHTIHYSSSLQAKCQYITFAHDMCARHKKASNANDYLPGSTICKGPQIVGNSTKISFITIIHETKGSTPFIFLQYHIVTSLYRLDR